MTVLPGYLLIAGGLTAPAAAGLFLVVSGPEAAGRPRPAPPAAAAPAAKATARPVGSAGRAPGASRLPPEGSGRPDHAFRHETGPGEAFAARLRPVGRACPPDERREVVPLVGNAP
jgi:hypothetical protein